MYNMNNYNSYHLNKLLAAKKNAFSEKDLWGIMRQTKIHTGTVGGFIASGISSPFNDKVLSAF